MKSLTYSKDPSSNPLQQVCSGFQITTCVILKIVPNAGFDMNVRKSTNDLYATENRPMTEKESRNRSSKAAFETFLSDKAA